MDAATLAAAKADAKARYGQDAGASDESKLRHIASSLADAANSPVDIVMVGDSEVEGRNASPLSNRWIDLLRDQLRGAFQPSSVPGGYGYVPVAYVYGATGYWALSGGLTLVSGGVYGLGRRVARMQSAGHTATLTTPVGTTDVDLCYTTGGTTTVTYTVDGGAGTPINTTDFNVENAARITGLNPTTTHTIVVTWTSGTDFWLQGAMLYGGDTSLGVRVWEGGSSGASSSVFSADTRWARRLSQINVGATVGPALIVVQIGTNDYGTGVSSATSAANLSAIIAACRTNTTSNPSFLVLGQWLRTDTTSPVEPWSNYISAYKRVAAADPKIAFYDLGARVGDDTTGLALVDTDHVHLTNKGHRVQAGLLFRLLSRLAIQNTPGTYVDSQVASATWARLTNGVESPPLGRQVITTSGALASGQVEYCFMQPVKDQTITKLAYCTRNTAGSGLTLGRIGLYTVDGSGNLTLVARTADASGSTSANTLYQLALATAGGYPAQYTMKAGVRYAVGIVFVGTTPPSLVCGNTGQPGGFASLSPLICAFQTGQTDLPTSVTAATLAANGHGNMFWAAALA